MMTITLTLEMSPFVLAALAHERAERLCAGAALATSRTASLDLKERSAHWYGRETALLIKGDADLSPDWGIAA